MAIVGTDVRRTFVAEHEPLPDEHPIGAFRLSKLLAPIRSAESLPYPLGLCVDPTIKLGMSAPGAAGGMVQIEGRHVMRSAGICVEGSQ